MRVSAFEIIREGEPWFHTGRNIMPQMQNRPEVMPRTIMANPDWRSHFDSEIDERFQDWMPLY